MSIPSIFRLYDFMANVQHLEAANLKENSSAKKSHVQIKCSSPLEIERSKLNCFRIFFHLLNRTCLTGFQRLPSTYFFSYYATDRSNQNHGSARTTKQK